MLRGIDVKQVILQTNPVEKVQQAQQQHPDMQQRYLEIQLSEQKKIQKEHVKSSEESERARIGQKKEEEKHRGSQKRKPDETNEAPGQAGQAKAVESKDTLDSRTGTIHIDIKV